MTWFLCRDRNSLGIVVVASELTWLYSRDRNGLDFSVGMGIDLFFACGWKMLGFVWRHRNRLHF